MHLSIYFFKTVCLLVDIWLVTEQYTHECGFMYVFMKGVEHSGHQRHTKKNTCPPLCWLPLVTPLHSPLYYTLLGYHYYIFLNPFSFHSSIPFSPLHPNSLLTMGNHGWKECILSIHDSPWWAKNWGVMGKKGWKSGRKKGSKICNNDSQGVYNIGGNVGV